MSDGVRQFNVKSSIDNPFSFALHEPPIAGRDYSFYVAKGVCKDLSTIAAIVDMWSEKHRSAREIAADFPDVELFLDFTSRHSDPVIDAAWTKVRNMFFRNEPSPGYEEWFSRYVTLIETAKVSPLLYDLIPFTSHYWLRFSVDPQITETWPLFIYIMPTFYGVDKPSDQGPFCVSYEDNENTKKYFRTADGAVAFLGETLQRVAPTKWT